MVFRISFLPVSKLADIPRCVIAFCDHGFKNCPNSGQLYKCIAVSGLNLSVTVPVPKPSGLPGFYFEIWVDLIAIEIFFKSQEPPL